MCLAHTKDTDNCVVPKRCWRNNHVRAICRFTWTAFLLLSNSLVAYISRTPGFRHQHAPAGWRATAAKQWLGRAARAYCQKNSVEYRVSKPEKLSHTVTIIAIVISVQQAHGNRPLLWMSQMAVTSIKTPLRSIRVHHQKQNSKYRVKALHRKLRCPHQV